MRTHTALLLTLVACGGSESTRAPEASSGEARIVYTGHGEGEIEPCG